MQQPQQTPANSSPRGIGDNSGIPVSGSVARRLAEEHVAVLEAAAALAKRATEAPKVIETEDEHALVVKIVQDATAGTKASEAMRVAEKAPYLAATREVDGFFSPVTDRYKKIGAVLTDRVDAFLKAKRDRERAAQEAIARAQREEAERRLAEATKAADTNPELADAHLEYAEQAEQQANATREDIDASSAADFARTRTATGLSTLRTDWKGEIVDYAKIDLEKLRPYLTRADVEKALRAYVKAGHRELAGARIYQHEGAVIR